MSHRLTLVCATLALSASAAFGQILIDTVGASFYAVGYAANLNIGDSVLNLSNAGIQGAFFGATPFKTEGNICVNVYTFDPQEEEIACCACLVTPNGLNSLSAKADLISNPLTPAIPTSIVVKLVSSEPAVDTTGAFTVCNPAVVAGAAVGNVVAPNAVIPYYTAANGPGSVGFTDPRAGRVATGFVAWGTTLEPNGTPGNYGTVNVPYLASLLSVSELTALTSTCNFIQGDGTGFGICKSCQAGALNGAKK
jgi:hypothetical protein